MKIAATTTHAVKATRYLVALAPDESILEVTMLDITLAATAHAGTTDSAVSPDGKFWYVESGGAGTVDVVALGADGSPTARQT